MRTENFDLSGDGRVRLRAFLHAPSEEMPTWRTRPAVVVCPGGGYNMLSDREAEPVAFNFLALGYHAFVLRYSIGDHAAWPNPVADLSRAVTLIREHSEEWNLMPDRIAVCGFSAGGHLAACLGTLWNHPEISGYCLINGDNHPNALILGYPCILYDPEWYPEIYQKLTGNRRDEEMSKILSCEKNVGDHTPPVFIFHTYSDNCVPVEHSMAFANAMITADRPVELHIFQNGIHGISLGTEVTSSGHKSMVNADASAWFPMAAAWLRDLFELKDSSITTSAVFGSPAGRAHLHTTPLDWSAALSEGEDKQ